MMAHLIKYAPEHPTRKNVYWCKVCQTWVKFSEMRGRVLDDDSTDKLCPGCDVPLVNVVFDYDEDV